MADLYVSVNLQYSKRFELTPNSFQAHIYAFFVYKCVTQLIIHLTVYYSNHSWIVPPYERKGFFLELPATGLFIEQFVHANNNENVKVLQCRSVCEGNQSTCDWCITTIGATKIEIVPYHDVVMARQDTMNQ